MRKGKVSRVFLRGLKRLRFCSFLASTLIARVERRGVQRAQLASALVARAGSFDILMDTPSFHREAVEKVVEALALIQNVDPRRYSWIERHLRKFYLTEIEGAQYWVAYHVCVLSSEEVMKLPMHEMALRIVHEAAHARISKAGVAWWTESFAQIEARCIKEEMGFCSSLGDRGYSIDDRMRYYERQLLQLEREGFPLRRV